MRHDDDNNDDCNDDCDDDNYDDCDDDSAAADYNDDDYDCMLLVMIMKLTMRLMHTYSIVSVCVYVTYIYLCIYN